MAHRIDPRLFNNSIDTMILHRTDDADEDAAVDEILRLARENTITVQLPHSVKSEIEHPNAPDYVRARAGELIYTILVELTAPEMQLHAEVRKIIQGNARPGKHDRDAYHMVESDKHGGGYFITRDARILSKAPEIEPLLPQLRVVTPIEFLKIYRQFQAG